MILSIQLKYTMKMEAVSDSSPAATELHFTQASSYSLITFTRMEPYILATTTTTTREEGTEEEEEWEETLKRLDF